VGTGKALAGRGLKVVRPLALAAGLGYRNAERDVGVSAMDLGDRALAEAVSAAVGGPLRTPTPGDLVVAGLAPGGTLGSAVERLVEHRRRGGEVLVAVLGSPVQQRRGIRHLQEEPDLGVVCAIPIPRLDARGAETLRAAVVQRLGVSAVPAARHIPTLRATAARNFIRGAARRAALVAAVPSSAATMPVLTVIQVRLATDVTALGGGRPGGREAGQVVGVAATGPVWRQAARLLSSAVPGAAVAVRAGVAYGVTRGVGALSERLRSDDSTPPEEDS
jgi:uncharacterized protein (DUF697 family)